MCKNCIHKPVCGKFLATGGHVNSCQHYKEERRREYWVRAGRGIVACTGCNHGIRENMMRVNRYCPSCGADMRGGKDA